MVSWPVRPEATPQAGQRGAKIMLQPDGAQPSQSVRTVITSIYAAAEISSFPANGAPTAIFKTPVHRRVQIGREGIVGDHQADRRVHGGPEKAVHHYAAINYSNWRHVFRLLLQASCQAASEKIFLDRALKSSVAIGDTFVSAGSPSTVPAA